MSEYRDISPSLTSYVYDEENDTWTTTTVASTSEAVDAIKRSQVYMATHDEGGNRLPLAQRSFISFSYGGVNIEDYNFISITEGDSISRNLYGNFNDITSSYEVMDGQIHWGSFFENNALSLRLVTDCLTEKELAELKVLFKPGVAKELILAENPNRGIMARISSPPAYELMVYEEKTSVKIAGQDYDTSTTLYKGFINVEFVMDDPYWYSIENIITDDTLTNNSDKVKMILEDGVPYKKSIDVDSGGYFYNYIMGDGNVYSHPTQNGWSVLQSFNMGISYSNFSHMLFYAGTAPAHTTLSFSIRPIIDAEHNNLIKNPYNSIYKSVVSEAPLFNKISIGSKDFKFTTPSIWTGYNQAIIIFNSFNTGDSYVEIKAALRDGIKEYYNRAWALFVLDKMQTNYFSNGNLLESYTNNDVTTTSQSFFNTNMLTFLYGQTSDTIQAANFTFNSKTGEAKINIKVKDGTTSTALSGETGNNYAEVVENVGDMVYDKYLILDERNSYSSTGTIGPAQCSAITTDYPTNITNISILYKHMYL